MTGQRHITELKITPDVLPLRTLAGIVTCVPRKQRRSLGCEHCGLAEQCELVRRLYGRWAVLPCEGVLVIEALPQPRPVQAEVA